MSVSTQTSVEAGFTATDVNDYKVTTTPTTFDASRQVYFNVGGTYYLFLAGRPTTAIAVTVSAEASLNWQVVKVTTAADGSGVVPVNQVYIIR